MNIEDLIILLATRCQMNPFDSKIVNSFYDQISRGNGFTEKQSDLAIKIISRHLPKINSILGQDAGQFLINPVFRLNKRTVSLAKRISVVPHDEFTKAIKVEFPYNESIVERIRKERTGLPFAAWDKDEKAWIFALHEKSVQLVGKITDKDDFYMDDEFVNYFSQIREIENNLEKYVPMVSYREKTPKFINVSPRVPQPQDNDLIKSLFEARKLGIHTWDNDVIDYLNENNVSPCVTSFLDSAPHVPFQINLEENDLADISSIVKNLLPAIFVIPGGSEFVKLQESLDFLKSIGIDNSEISVLFRLPSETGEEFNKFVKTSLLNNPVTSQTKAIFISGKIPKTIIDSNVKFNCIVNFNFYSIHYTIREFIKHHENVIHVLEKKPQRNMNFAFL